MIKGLTRAGLGNIGSNEQFVRLAAQYGFGAVDADAQALIGELGEEGAKALLKETGVVIGAAGLPVEWRKSEEDFRRGFDKLETLAKENAALGCKSFCTYILPSTDESAAVFMAKAVRRMRECALILGEYVIRLGLEFVGPHHLRTAWKNPFIWTVEETLEMIGAIGEPNVGLLIDSYHCYTTGFTGDDIRMLRDSQIVHAHINDARDIPVEEVKDNDRLYPGEGVIDLADYLGALRDIGYDGVVAQEILTKEQPTDSPETLLARSKAGFDRVWK